MIESNWEQRTKVGLWARDIRWIRLWLWYHVKLRELLRKTFFLSMENYYYIERVQEYKIYTSSFLGFRTSKLPYIISLQLIYYNKGKIYEQKIKCQSYTRYIIYLLYDPHLVYEHIIFVLA